MTDEDWAALPAVAHRHGVSAVLHRAFAHRTDVPDVTREAVESAVRTGALNGLRGMSELIRMAGALQHNAIGCVALKGPAFSQWLYGDVGFRRFGDLDLLVAPADLQRAYAVLGALGYQLREAMSAKTAGSIYGGLGAWPLAADGMRPVDLHWRLAHIGFAAPLDAPRVIAHATSLEAGGRSIPIPCATHAALLTLLHAAKHLWCTLELLFSIARLMERDDVDWRLVQEMARDARAWTGCASGLMLASELFSVELPAAVSARAAAAASPALRHDALVALGLPVGIFQDRWSERRAHRAAFDHWRQQFRYDVWRIVAPTPLEWEWCPLPDRLTALYPPVRLIRLGVAAVGRALRPLRPARSRISGTAAPPAASGDGARPSTRGDPESRERNGRDPLQHH